MFTYIPFEDNDVSTTKLKKSAIAYPGHLVGIYARFFSSNFIPSWISIAISDIGATKAYLLDEVHITPFLCGSNTGFILNGSTDPIFVPLDHIIENNHKVTLEAKNPSSDITKLKGVFIYESE